MLQAIISSTDPSRHDRGQRCLMFGACLRAESGISRHRRNAGRDPCRTTRHRSRGVSTTRTVR